MANEQQRDLLIIGGGPAGLVITSVAAQLGLKVTLIEKQEKLGGDCLHSGCVPSKTLIQSAKVAQTFRLAGQYGIEPINPEVDFAKVKRRVQSVINHIQQHDDPERFRDYGAEVLFGKAQFIDPHRVEINGETRFAKRIVLCMGSRAVIPPIPGLDQVNFLTNETIFKLDRLPSQLVVLGGGVIGVELAQAFARLGSKVTVIEMAKQLLPNHDSDLAECLLAQFKKTGIVAQLNTRVNRIEQRGDKISVSCVDEQGQVLRFQADELLVAAGRMPNVDTINLADLGIEFNQHGVAVDKRLRTRQKHIYAAGDIVASPYKFTHVAEAHAGIVISNALFRFPKRLNEQAIPTVVYTDPEVATVGMTEKQAIEAEIDYHVERFDFADIDRALTDGHSTGFAKLILQKGKLLGASIIGPSAGELISEFTLALNAKLSLKQISDTIHAYPTLAQINRRVVNKTFTSTLFSERTKKFVMWLNRWL